MKSGWLLVGVLCVVLPEIAWAGDPCDPCGGNCGEVLGTLRDVEAFSNGARGNCTGTGRGFYQCVEYAKRYNGRTGERWGNANQIFGRATRLGLRSFRNGETEAPRQGDAITFQGGRYGHIAIIYEVGSDFVTLIEQNWHNVPGHFRRLEMDVDSGRYTVVSDSRIYTVEGWLRPDIDPTLIDDDGDTVSESEGDCNDANADIHPGVTELCNSLDDDCDSETDETWPLIGDACTFRPTPLCERTGVWVCEPLHRGTICEGDREIRDERCNSLDDNCDGEIDEDWPLLGVACDAGFGECRASGVWECEPLLGGSICSADIGTPSPELCDGLDNDCDRETDEDWPELGSACGIYPCDGVYVCSLGGSGSYCNSDPGMPETCDSLDNDCDGETDESPAELSCSDGNDCTADSCLSGLCQNVGRDRDGDTYMDDLCGGSDCNDLNPAVWSYAFAQSRLTNSSGLSYAPVIAWTGAEIGVAWSDWRDGNYEIYFTRVIPTLAKIGDDVRVTNYSSSSQEPAIIWTGSEYGIAWSDLRSSAMNIYFTRLDTVGGKMVDDTVLSDAGFGHSAREPAIGWNGSEYDIVYSDNTSGGYDILLARVDPGGVEIGLESLAVFGGYGPTISWTGSDYGLAWNAVAGGALNVYFGRIVPESPRILPADATTVMSFSSYLTASAFPNLVWQGSLFALVGSSYSTDNNEIYFARVDASGGEIGSEVQITHNPSSSEMPTLISRGGEYGLTWEENPSGLGGPAYFARLDETGGMLGLEVQITSSKNGGEKVSLIWTGHEYVMAWSDNRDGDWEIYLGRIGCGW